MLSQKRGYKVNFLFKHLGLVADAKKMTVIVTNRLLDNKRKSNYRHIKPQSLILCGIHGHGTDWNGWW